MKPLLIFIVSLIPGLLWVWYFYRKDRYEPEPVSLVLKSFFFGAIAVIPTGILESALQGRIGGTRSYLELAILTFIVVGLTEEYFKYVALRYAVYNYPHFNERMDGIIYGVSAGLGFSALENLMYAMNPELTVSGIIQLGIIRSLFASAAHASFTGTIGYYLGKAKFDRENAKIHLRKGFIIAVGLHGLYDFLILGGILQPFSAFALVVIAYTYLGRKIDKSLILSSLRRKRASQAGTADDDDESSPKG